MPLVLLSESSTGEIRKNLDLDFGRHPGPGFVRACAGERAG
jgi:hypothetical protein